MNGTPLPRRGWRAAHKKEKNYHRYDSEYASYQRRKVAGKNCEHPFGPSLLFTSGVRTSRRVKNP